MLKVNCKRDERKAQYVHGIFASSQKKNGLLIVINLLNTFPKNSTYIKSLPKV